MEKGMVPNSFEVKYPYEKIMASLWFAFRKTFFLFFFDRYWSQGPEASYLRDLEYLRGFHQIQEAIDRAYLTLVQQNLTNSSGLFDEVGVFLQEFPYPCFEQDWFMKSMYIAQILPIAVIFGFMVTLATNTRQQLWERESQNSQVRFSTQ